jgi:hypothetical protein
VGNEATTWRDTHNGVCDTPNLYFAVLPNGDFAPCCDYRMETSVATYAPEFPDTYRSRTFRADVHKIASACEGCMYGSYPEITISMRFLAAKLQRVSTFLTAPPAKNWPLSYSEILGIAESVRAEKRERIRLPARRIADVRISHG